MGTEEEGPSEGKEREEAAAGVHASFSDSAPALLLGFFVAWL
jgi:hypothetical protein